MPAAPKGGSLASTGIHTQVRILCMGVGLCLRGRRAEIWCFAGLLPLLRFCESLGTRQSGGLLPVETQISGWEESRHRCRWRRRRRRRRWRRRPGPSRPGRCARRPASATVIRPPRCDPARPASERIEHAGAVCLCFLLTVFRLALAAGGDGGGAAHGSANGMVRPDRARYSAVSRIKNHQ